MSDGKPVKIQIPHLSITKEDIDWITKDAPEVTFVQDFSKTTYKEDTPMEVSVGDVVRLRAGGPHCTVITEAIHGERIEICWFTEQGEYRTARVPAAALLKVT